ncbi:MAG: glycoside hydrolase family 3 N-terminal domain-containing protein, partial [Catalinimonas sp.]
MRFLLMFSGLLLTAALAAQPRPPAFLEHPTRWADSVLATLTPDERIAQLIMVAAYSNRDEAHQAEIERLVREQKIGGLVFFQGGPGRQARLTNRYQAAADVPLLIAIDAEWGLIMRLDSTVKFPYQMTLGALPDDSLIYRMGRSLAAQCRRLGVHVNFAPVIDVNNNPANPVINFRSFGEDRARVARKGVAYARGMQDGGLLTSAKHFPGHGDTDTDSHLALPLISHGRRRLDSLELYPFRRVIDAGVAGIMVAHLSVPALDTTAGRASTLSRAIVTDLLKGELGFRGLTFTDAMNMRAVADHYPPGEADARALLAGNDVLEFTQDVAKTISEVRRMIEAGTLTQAAVDARCRKMLLAKAWVGLDHYAPVALENLVEDLNPPAAAHLNRQLFEGSLTALRNEGELLPLRDLSVRVASVSVGAGALTPFQRMLDRYTTVTHHTLPVDAPAAEVARVRAALRDHDVVLLGVHPPSVHPTRNYGLQDAFVRTVGDLVNDPDAPGRRTVVALFGNPYALPR